MRNPQFPSVPQAVLVLLAIIIGQLVLGSAVGIVIVVTKAAPNSLLVWFTGLGNLLLLGGAAWVGWLLARRPARQVFPLRPVGWEAAALVMPACWAAQVLLSELDNIIRLYFPPPAFIDQFMRELTGSGIWGALVLLVVVAPLTEEPLFRGLLLRGFRSRHGFWAAAWWSALLFAVFHLNPWQMPAALLLGLFFAWLTLRSGSLLPAILGHAAANSLSVIAIYGSLERLIPGLVSQDTSSVVLQPRWLDASALLLFALCLAALSRLLPREEADGGETENAVETVDWEMGAKVDGEESS